MTRNVFSKLMGLFVLLLVFQTSAMELILRRFVEHAAGAPLHCLDREALWAGLIALLVALPVAAWAASGIHRAPAARRSFRAPHRRRAT